MKKLTILLLSVFSLSLLLAGCGPQGPDPSKERQELQKNRQNDERER